MTARRVRGFQRVERWAVGLVMALLAFVVERAVLRSIRRGKTPVPSPEPTAITGSGAEIVAD
jgi:hypothetical protein